MYCCGAAETSLLAKSNVHNGFGSFAAPPLTVLLSGNASTRQGLLLGLASEQMLLET